MCSHNWYIQRRTTPLCFLPLCRNDTKASVEYLASVVTLSRTDGADGFTWRERPHSGDKVAVSAWSSQPYTYQAQSWVVNHALSPVWFSASWHPKPCSFYSPSFSVHFRRTASLGGVNGRCLLSPCIKNRSNIWSLILFHLIFKAQITSKNVNIGKQGVEQTSTLQESPNVAETVNVSDRKFGWCHLLSYRSKAATKGRVKFLTV